MMKSLEAVRSGPVRSPERTSHLLVNLILPNTPLTNLAKQTAETSARRKKLVGVNGNGTYLGATPPAVPLETPTLRLAGSEPAVVTQL